MKIAHVTGYFVEKMAYQENLLPLGQFLLGHEVIIITGIKDPDFGFNRDTRVHPVGRFASGGVIVSRIRQWFDLGNRGPVLRGLYAEIRLCRPDVLFIHDVGPSLVIGLIYKCLNPSVRLHFDCHSTYNNARQSWIGPAYHAVFKQIFRVFRAQFEKIFAVAPECIRFINEIYGVPLRDITLLPLPGDAALLAETDRIRPSVRRMYGLADEDKVLVHTGKLPGDKLTAKVLDAFCSLRGDQYRLCIAGHVDADFREVLDRYLSSDARIRFLGWLDADDLRKLFISSDLLVAPGSLSNTFIDAVCCGLPVLLDETPQGRFLTQWGNGITVSRSSVVDLSSELERCTCEPLWSRIRAGAASAAYHLDYRAIARASLAEGRSAEHHWAV
ncbi:MAG: glycosyltransferase family 4 protein [Gammaproteobacteria bacterium]|nr:glycosyltransferase family 4 protein [Gammaproteobacteria bacterium]